MAGKLKAVYTTLVDIERRGTATSEPRIYVVQMQHNGIDANEDRDILLVLTPLQAVQLATKLLGTLTLDMHANPAIMEAMRKVEELVALSHRANKSQD